MKSRIHHDLIDRVHSTEEIDSQRRSLQEPTIRDTSAVRLTLGRLAVVDLNRKRGMAGVQIVGLATAIALAVALPLMQSVAAEEGLHSALASLGAGANLEIGLDQVDSLKAFDAFQADASHRVRLEMGPLLIPAARFARSNRLQPVSLDGQQLAYEPGDPVPVATYFENLKQHVVVTSGNWPVDGRAGNAWPAAVSETAAAALDLKVGDLYCVGPIGGSRRGPAPWCARIDGVWKPHNPTESYWAGQVLGTDLMLGRSSLFEVAAATGFTTLHAGQFHVTDLTRVHAADAGAIQEHLRHLHGFYGVTSDATFITGLDGAIQSFLARLQSQQVLAVSIEAALLAVALYAIALAATHFLDGQKRLIGLWRARGGSRRQAWTFLMIQFGVLALLALPIGGLVGIVAVDLVGGRLFGNADVLQGGILATAAPTLLAAIGAIAVVLGVLSGDATLRTVSEVRRRESRPALSAWWRWRNLDIGLAVAGLLLIGEARLQAGQTTPSAGQDPLGLILPGVALALLALAALRLLPLIAHLVAREAGLARRLAGWRLQREPLQHARVALILSFALALSVFTSTYLATDQRNAVDRARYAAGSDVRASFGFGTGPSVLDGAIAAAPGVVASSLVFRDSGRPGKSDVSATVLGVDPYSLQRVAWWRDDLAGQPLPQLMGELLRGDPDGASIPGRPQALSLWVFSTGLDASLEADLEAADGSPIHASFGSLSFRGWNTLEAPLSRLAVQDFPLRLRTLVMKSTGPNTTGEIDLSELRAGPPGGSAPMVEAFSAAGGWWQEMVGQFGGVAPLRLGSRPRNGEASTGLMVDLTGGATLALHPAPSSAALPGLVSTETAAKLGVGVGQSLPLHIETHDVTVRLIGTVDYFPTLYPGQDDFLVVPAESLLERLRRLNSYVYPNEAWMRVGGSPDAAGIAVQNATHGQAQVNDRETLEASALRSPLRLSLDAALIIGLVAALSIVVIGFGLHFLAVARSRVSESAIMQANGLPWRIVNEGLLTEQVVVLVHSLIVGAALGALMAWAILPVLQSSVLPADLIPPTIVTLDVRTLLGATLAVLAAAGIMGQLAMRSASAFRLNDELRALA